MDCKIAGRPTRNERADINVVTYGLTDLTPGQARYAHNRANAFLQKCMMDNAAPDELKTFLRSQNAVGMLIVQDLLAAFHNAVSKDRV